jgi:hypothetical protein
MISATIPTSPRAAASDSTAADLIVKVLGNVRGLMLASHASRAFSREIVSVT